MNCAEARSCLSQIAVAGIHLLRTRSSEDDVVEVVDVEFVRVVSAEVAVARKDLTIHNELVNLPSFFPQ